MENNNTNDGISVAELNVSLKQSPDKFYIIDLMSKFDYDERHIPGAINIPIEELTNRKSEIPTDKTVVVACNRGLMKSEMGLQKLQDIGFNNVKKLIGGTSGWFDSSEM